MKKLIKIFCIISAFVFVLLMIAGIMLGGKDLRSHFLLENILCLSVPFAIPAVSRLILIPTSNKFSPRVWVIKYCIILSIFLIFIIANENYKTVGDFPSLIKEEYSEITGSLQENLSANNYREICISGVELKIVKNSIYSLSSNVEYKFVYLPNSKHVIDVIDENGNSLLK